jgi:hypothetical protein
MSNAEARASQAQRLMDDPLLIEALGNIRAAAIQAWEATPVQDANGSVEGPNRQREIAWLTVKVVRRIEAELQSIIDNGKIAAARVQNPLR